MPLKIHIPEILSYVGMKDTKYWVKCLLFLPKYIKLNKEVNPNTIFFLNIYLALFHFLVLLISILKYVYYFKIPFILKYNIYHIL